MLLKPGLLQGTEAPVVMPWAEGLAFYAVESLHD